MTRTGHLRPYDHNVSGEGSCSLTATGAMPPKPQEDFRSAASSAGPYRGCGVQRTDSTPLAVIGFSQGPGPLDKWGLVGFLPVKQRL